MPVQILRCQNLGYLAFYDKSLRKGDFRAQAPFARAEIPRTNLSDWRCRPQRLDGVMSRVVEQLTSTGVFWNEFQSECFDVFEGSMIQHNTYNTKKGILSDASSKSDVLLCICLSTHQIRNPECYQLLRQATTTRTVEITLCICRKHACWIWRCQSWVTK